MIPIVRLVRFGAPMASCKQHGEALPLRFAHWDQALYRNIDLETGPLSVCECVWLCGQSQKYCQYWAVLALTKPSNISSGSAARYAFSFNQQCPADFRCRKRALAAETASESLRRVPAGTGASSDVFARAAALFASLPAGAARLPSVPPCS